VSLQLTVLMTKHLGNDDCIVESKMLKSNRVKTRKCFIHTASFCTVEC